MATVIDTPAVSGAPGLAGDEGQHRFGLRVSRWRRSALLAVGIVAIAVTSVRLWTRLAAPTSLPQAVVASGRIEGREVTVAPKEVQARVARLLVDEGDTVTRGQLLAVLESRQLEARVTTLAATMAAIDVQIAQARSDQQMTVKSSAASIAAADAAVRSARAHVERAAAVLDSARADHERAVSLFDDRVISQRELDQIELQLHTSEADVHAAERELERAQANFSLASTSQDGIELKRQQVRALQASRRAAESQLAEGYATLQELQVVAPLDGTVLSRPVEVGDVVNPGSPLFQLVDMRRLYVKVYIPERDVQKLRLGAPGAVSIDAFPERTFAARVTRIHDQAEFTPKNVETADERLKLVFGVELTFEGPDRHLKPGMPADCRIPLDPGTPAAP